MTLPAWIVKDIIDVAEGLHKCGTFGPRPLAALAEHLSKRHIKCSAETGSGASTLLFSHSSDLHLAFTIDSAGGSVDNVKISPLLRQDRVVWIEGPSQLTLPTYQFQEKLQAVLIDGPHAYPFPDLEYYYLYQHLETGALLVIDDIQIPTIHNLFEFLRKDAMFVLDEVVDTTAFFTRTDAPMFCPTGDSWWEQEFNKTPLNVMEVRIDPGEVRSALATCKIFSNAVGSINPRPPGLHNDLIQHIKKLMSRLLAWYTRPQREFNSSVVRSLDILASSIENLQTNLQAMDGRLTQLERDNTALTSSLQKYMELLAKLESLVN